MKKFLFLKIFFLTLYSPTIFAITCSTGSGGSATYSWKEVRGDGDANGLTRRYNHQSVEFEDKLWAISGTEQVIGAASSDLWFSTNGKDWEAADNVGFGTRNGHRSVVFDNRMWVIGGVASARRNDVWSSTNGTSWTQVTNNAKFSARNAFTAVVFNDGTSKKIYVIGGRDDTGVKNDVWSSADGITWNEEVTNNPKFSARQSHSSVNFDDKIWVIGGFDGSSQTNSVWSSANGKDWEKVTDNADFSARNAHQSVVFDNKMWVIGGSDNVDKNDVWSSTDGKKWTRETDNAGFDARSNFASVVFKNDVYVIGGLGRTFFNDVWSMTKD